MRHRHPSCKLCRRVLRLLRQLPDLLLVHRLVDHDLRPDVVVLQLQLLYLVQQALVLGFYHLDPVHYIVL